MERSAVLLVAGTHGNELNALWLLNQWQQQPDLLKHHDWPVHVVTGNPAACASCRRYVDFDLNRIFCSDLIQAPAAPSDNLELRRARELVAAHGPMGSEPCKIAIDLHNTTAAMGSCLVVYGHRPADLALAALIQNRLGLPVYLHENDPLQTGFLVSFWPCGLVIEIGPVPQGVVRCQVVEQARLALQAVFDLLTAVESGSARYPKHLVVHKHVQNINRPRDRETGGVAEVAAERDGRDWQPIHDGAELFQTAAGEPIQLVGWGDSPVVPVFINEAAYTEKGIALSLTKREIWPLADCWKKALQCVLQATPACLGQ
ncbi:aspartoacylase [cyanobiont of Ornithocercus magnificus]|nr:aspartoacylase [cyanobiont of Ornithocercus magnificus]